MAKSHFLAAASHDLRQPLHAMGLLLVSLMPKVQGTVAQKLIRDIEVSLETLNKLFATILDLSRLEAAVLKPEIRPLVMETIFDHLRGRCFALPAREIGTRFADPPLPSQGNERSGYAGTHPGQPDSQCRSAYGHGPHSGWLPPEGENLQIGVWDTDPSIPRDQMTEVFKEYYQIHNTERTLALACHRRLPGPPAAASDRGLLEAEQGIAVCGRDPPGAAGADGTASACSPLKDTHSEWNERALQPPAQTPGHSDFYNY